MREIYIYGDIVDKESDKSSPEDVCPQDIIAQTKETDEDLTIRINSCGGSVSAGLSIATYLQSLKQKTTCIVDGVAASIASVIACSGDELVMHPSSYLMVHRVWGNVVGNSEDLRKEADTMEKMTNSLIKIYQRKFDLSEDEIAKLLADETWISGEQISDYKIKATVDDDSAVKYAAKICEKHFNNLPSIMKNEEEKKLEEEEKKEETPVETPVEEEKKPAEEEKQEETPVETPVEEEKKPAEEEKQEEKPDPLEELKRENEELKKQIEELKSQDVEKRVSGMQSKMQNKINDLTKEFTNKLETTTKELDSYKTECISLKSQLEESTKSVGELQAKVSALTDEVTQKQTALDQLNSGVLTHPVKAESVNWRNLTGRDFLDYLAKHPEIITQK